MDGLTPIAGFWPRFRDEGLEDAFLAQLARKSQAAWRRAYRNAILIWCAFLVWDAIVIPEVHRLAWFLRLTIAVPAILAAWALGYAPQSVFARFWQRVGCAAFTISGLAIVLMQVLEPERVAPFMPVALVELTLIIHTAAMLRFGYATASSCAILVAYVVTSLEPVHLPLVALFNSLFWLMLVNAIGMLASRSFELFRRRDFHKTRMLETEKAKSEHLLLNILPQEIAEQLKEKNTAVAEGFDEVTVLFADIVGFTHLSERIPPVQLVALLNEVFSSFDRLSERHGLEKIKTIGDAYMAAAGVPVRRADHAEAVAGMALDMLEEIRRFEGLKLRIGIHSGPVVAGVIGERKFSYDLWGDTVNMASRMESHGVSGEVHVSAETYERLQSSFELEPRGGIEVKGKGRMATWLLKRRRKKGPASPAES